MRLCAVLVAVALLCPCASLWVPATGTPSPAWCSQHYSSAELGIFSRHWCCRTDAAWSWPGVPRPSNASFAHLLVPLRDKRLLLAGDSTTQQTFDGLQIGLLMAGVLFSVHKRPRKPVPVPQLDGYDITPYNITHGYSGDITVLVVAGYNLTITNVEFWHLQLPGVYDALSESIAGDPEWWHWRHLATEEMRLGHAEFEALVHLSDVAIVNAGAHFNTPRVTLSVWNTYARTVTYVRDVLSRDGLRQPSKRHLWRASFPIHANIDGRCSPTASLDDTQNWMNRVAGNIVGGEVPVLDMWPVMEAQGAYGGRAGPIPENLTRRAVHWCFVYELFYVFWELVAAHVASSEVWPGNSKPYGHEAAGVHSATEQRQLAELLGL